jgi:hypothetical protein
MLTDFFNVIILMGALQGCGYNMDCRLNKLRSKLIFGFRELNTIRPNDTIKFL